jgi:hypothetical protein
VRVVNRSRTQLVVRFVAAVSLAGAFLAAGNVAGLRAVSLAAPVSVAQADGGCQLNSPSGTIHHVIYIQFDNVHLRRDNPNVPSDLQQMPKLLNFLKGNGTLLSNEHTPLIAHTADDIITSMTGVYGDRHGQPISNSFDYFDNSGVPHFTSSFEYWTDPLADGTPYMANPAGKIAPAPWVPYTRAGCNVGAFSTANIELENVGSDLTTVFGANSPQVQEAASDHAKAVADFEGIAVHCATGNATCAAANGGVTDSLPDEPGGYTGYNALFGAKYVNPVITGGNAVVNDFNGQPVQDSHGNPGFPGFSPTATQSLAYTADMQEHGVPVTYTYIADTHDNLAGGTFGPGEAGYVAQNKAYNTAFGKFFTNLAQHGINKSNTLFVVTADEGDHFVGGPPSPAGCNGVTTPCTYTNVGELDANMAGLLSSEANITSPFDIHFDSAPNFYINTQPAQNDQKLTRPFERAVGRLTGTNPITGKTDKLTRYLADQAEMKLLHMITSDPMRDAQFTDFGNSNYYFQTYDQCTGQLICEGSGFAWNHGDIGTDINTTFLGFVGPGVAHLGIDNKVWSDHTDIRPTMLSLLGLRDDYSHEGRVITEILTPTGMNGIERHNASNLHRLAVVYKQINAPVGALSLDTIQASTKAAESGSAGNDSEYTRFDEEVGDLTNARNDLADEIENAIENAEFNGISLNTRQVKLMVKRGLGLIAWGKDMARSYS